jgi:hypothetical protein
MVHKLRSRAYSPVRVARSVMAIALAWSSLAASLPAETPPVHFQHAGIMPPGAIGSEQLQRGGPLPGYFQPVEIRAPEGTVVATAALGQFDDPQPAPMIAGLLIGSVYRLRVSNIPLQPGMEVFPTIEVIDRLYPPAGLEFKFPIPIEISQEELEMALAGKFVTRVIYLEEPDTALPVARAYDEQPYFEVGDGDSPLDVADALGRPMAILRMGARVPDAGGPDATFLYGCPALLKWRPAAAQPTLPAGAYAQGGVPTVRHAAGTFKPLVTILRGTGTR